MRFLQLGTFFARKYPAEIFKIVLDNEALYDICQTKLDIRKPTETDLNKIIAKVVSSMVSENVQPVALFFIFQLFLFWVDCGLSV